MANQFKACEACGKQANYKTGNKNGKQWAGWFCVAVKDHVEWIPQPKSGSSKKGEVDWDKINREKNEYINHLNARNGAIEIVKTLIKQFPEMTRDEIANALKLWTGVLEEI